MKLTTDWHVHSENSCDSAALPMADFAPAAAAVEHGTAIEINLGAMLLSRAYPETFAGQYLEYLARLKQRGVVFSIGSDTHAVQYIPEFERAAEMLDSIGLRDEEMWRLPPREA